MNYKSKTFSLGDLEALTPKTQNDLKIQLLKESEICPLCQNKIEKPVLDHQHLTKSETLGENGGGLIRAVLCNNCNQMLGKIETNSKRFLIADLPKFLINAAKYLEQDNLPYIHSSETWRLKTPFSKSEYNKLIKQYCQKYNRTKEYATKKFKYNKYLNKNLRILKDSII